jgi:hypothetical protein
MIASSTAVWWAAVFAARRAARSGDQPFAAGLHASGERGPQGERAADGLGHLVDGGGGVLAARRRVFAVFFLFDARLRQFAERPGQAHADLAQLRQHPQMPLAAFDGAHRFRHRGGVDVRVVGRDRVEEDAVKHGGVYRRDDSICQVLFCNRESQMRPDPPSPSGRSTREAGDVGVDAELRLVSNASRTAPRPSSGPPGHLLPQGEKGHFILRSTRQQNYCYM